MVKIKSFIVLIALLVLGLFAGCGNQNTDANLDGNDISNPSSGIEDNVPASNELPSEVPFEEENDVEIGELI